ncbi:MAG: ATP-binding protein [Tepidanaerobacteraceae bacterium]|jgi:AAA+ ATPase superfamily predicted ATPase|nr:ATP-binding protein [Tepidanaerobacteraceae bacterium]
MFIGRKTELEKLEMLYRKKGFQFIIMYGRRRVGKTTLMLEFCKGKPSIFFVAEEYNDKIALQKFSEKIFEFFKINDFMSAFESWEKAFLFLAKQAENRRLVVVLDEFPYIVSANKSIPSILQNLIDHHLIGSELFLLVCGSSLSFMEKEVLSYKSPLYGRRTSQFSIEPFGFYDSIKFFKSYSAEDKVKAYSIAGGIPQYLLKLDENVGIKENIIMNFLDKTSYLHEEPKNLLKQELREPALYNSIIEAIAKGASKLNEISAKIGEDNDKCAKYIKTLLELKIIEKETPIVNPAKRSVYKIKDNLFRFWYRFVFPNTELIEQGMYEYLYETHIKKELNHYIAPIFEEICIEFLAKMNKKMALPFVFDKIGRWWGNNPLKKQEEEIDIIAYSGDKAIFGECKWTNELMDNRIVDGLMEKSAIFNSFKEKYYCFFSKSGFCDEVVARAKANDNIKLYSLDDIADDSPF